ncbi:hypothetical protein OIU78_000827 [Salix suchowensis]|nr:hypothetical protein OIU78_000827 [Salix suchowensis]
MHVRLQGGLLLAAQREKLLDKQLHSLMEQLAAKQAQAEGLVGEIHLKEMELERLKGLWRMIESSNVEGNTARNRFGRSTSEKGSASTDYMVDKLPYSTGGRTEHQERPMLLRSAFVMYILFLNIVVLALFLLIKHIFSSLCPKIVEKQRRSAGVSHLHFRYFFPQISLLYLFMFFYLHIF